MARLIGPSEASREVKTIVATAGVTRDLFRAKKFRPATYYTDPDPTAAPTTSMLTGLADIRNLDGSAVTDSTVTTDAYSMLPLIQFPDGADSLLIQVDGGPPWRVYAREDDQIDDLQTRVATLELGGSGVPASRQITAGPGLTGGGNLIADRTLAVAYGTTASTAAQGDDSRITGAAQKTANLSDLGSAGTARTNLGLGGAATLSVGATAGTVAAGDDSRITGAALAARTITTTAPLTGGGDLSANRTLAVSDAAAGSKGVVQLAGDLAGSAAAPTVPGLTGKVGKGDLLVNVRDSGAVGDGRRVSDAAITAGTATLTSASAAFTAGDVGKTVIVWHAGSTVDSYTVGLAQQFVTTIAAYVNATTVTLAATAVTTVSAARATIATDDTTAITNAQALLSKGKELHFPGSTGFYLTRIGMRPPAAGITYSAQSKSVEVHLSHPSFPMPAVDCIDRDDITVRDISFVSEDGHIWTNAQLGAANYRGDGPMLNHSAVWCNADRLHVHNVTSTDFENSVYLSPWNTTLASFAQDGKRADCVIENVTSIDEFCAVLMLSTVRPRFTGISKRGYVSSYGAPGHAIYHSGAGSSAANYPGGLYSVDFQAHDIRMIDDTTSGGGTVSLKYIKGGQISKVYARNNPLLYSVGLLDFDFDDMLGVDMTHPKDVSGQNFFCVDSVSDSFAVASARVTFNNCRMTTTSAHAAGLAAVAFFHGNDIRGTGIDITTYRDSTVATTASLDVNFWGSGLRFRNFRIKNAAPNDGGSGIWPILVGNPSTTTDIEFDGLAVENWRYAMRVYSAFVTDLRVAYSPAALAGVDNRSTTAAITSIGAGTGNLRLQRSDYTKVLSVTGSGQTMIPSPALETVTQIDATTADAFTVGAPSISVTPYSGTEHTVQIRNATAGTLGTITWNAAWALRAAFVAPPAGETHNIVFAYNGTAWREVSRSQGAETPATASTPPDIQDFTASGTWTKPAGAKTVYVTLVGGGGGGGSGRKGADGTVRCGGGGGGAGAVIRGTFDAADLAASVAIAIGGSGAGGAAVATDSANGNSGVSGGTSAFGTGTSALWASGGGAGSGGNAATGTGGSGVLGAAGSLGAGASASTTGAAGVGTNPGVLSAGAGASGGGITSANAPGNGAGGGGSFFGTVTGSTGGAVDAAAPTGGTAVTIKGAAGPGAGSGAASVTTNAQAGANAVNYGGGGGGGGAAKDGIGSSGAGGNGAPGRALVITYF